MNECKSMCGKYMKKLKMCMELNPNWVQFWKKYYVCLNILKNMKEYLILDSEPNGHFNGLIYAQDFNGQISILASFNYNLDKSSYYINPFSDLPSFDDTNNIYNESLDKLRQETKDTLSRFPKEIEKMIIDLFLD